MTTILLSLLACGSREAGSRPEPSFLQVTLGDFTPGTAEAPLPFSSAAVTVPVAVQALDRNGEPADIDGDMVLQVRPGTLAQDKWITLSGGAWSGDVAIKNGFGPTRIWVSDEGDKDIDSARAPGFAAGVSPALHFRFPTLEEMQATTDPETNQLEGEFARLRVDDRRVVVTARETAGFWATDLDSPAGSGNSLYVYTFSRPSDDYPVGRRLGLLSGINQEYLASTQLSYPTLEPMDEILEVPAAIPLSACTAAATEGLEASRVVLNGGQIPATFTPGSEEFADFERYGQWPIKSGSCTFYVESGGAAPDFYAPDHAGETLPSVSGMLKQVFDKVVIVVVDDADIALAARNPSPPRRSSR